AAEYLGYQRRLGNIVVIATAPARDASHELLVVLAAESQGCDRDSPVLVLCNLINDGWKVLYACGRFTICEKEHPVQISPASNGRDLHAACHHAIVEIGSVSCLNSVDMLLDERLVHYTTRGHNDVDLFLECNHGEHIGRLHEIDHIPARPLHVL